MATTRQNKVARLIHKNLGEIFQQEAINYCRGAMITVTKVNVTPDLSIARTNISIYGTNDKLALLKLVKDDTKEIRHKLAVRIKNQVRIIPNLEFFIDDSLDYIENIEKLLKK
ncbi:MAG: 30S ribosome-binding factor RbfA [Bacteroidales bacterium]|nr:30S ribosome-binding factor RbfA [Bacteroidales bacterium]